MIGYFIHLKLEIELEGSSNPQECGTGCVIRGGGTGGTRDIEESAGQKPCLRPAGSSET
jgi:hypothetical protein